MKTNAGGGQLDAVEYRAAKEMTKADSYAAALVELAKAEVGLDAVDKDLRLVKSTLAEHMKLKTALADAGVATEQKQKVIEEVFAGGISQVTLNFLLLLAGMGQIDLLPEVAEKFSRRLEAVENKVVAEVTTAVPMDEEFSARIGERLSGLAGREVTIRSSVDPGIIGGIVVRMAGKLLDGSVQNQLERLKNEMLIDMRGK